MYKLSKAAANIMYIDRLSNKQSIIHSMNTTVKIVLTVLFVLVCSSFNRYALIKLLPMGIYLISLFILSDLGLKPILKRLLLVLPVGLLFGLGNFLFDNNTILIYNIPVKSSIISAAVLIVKLFYCVCAAYFLIATSGMDKIVRSLLRLHVPDIIVTAVMLTYRYLSLLVKCASELYDSYSLRMPNSKSIHIKTWASMVGQLLIRSSQRAYEVYDSMLLRGYDQMILTKQKEKISAFDIVFSLVCAAVFFIIRFTNILEWLGGMFI